MLYRSTPYRRKEGAASRAPSSPSLGPYSPPNAARSQDNVGGARPPPARWSPGHPTRGRRPPARASLLPLVLASAAASFLILWLTGGFGGAPRPPHPPSAGAADDDVLDRYRSGSVQVHAGARGGLPVGTVEERASAALGVLEAHHGSGGLREGAGRHERAAAALLLADILVQAEHDVVADAAMAAGLGPDDGDYVAMAGGGTHAYLPYEVDALDCPYFAVAAWIRPDEGGGGGGRQGGGGGLPQQAAGEPGGLVHCAPRPVLCGVGRVLPPRFRGFRRDGDLDPVGEADPHRHRRERYVPVSGDVLRCQGFC